MSCPSRCVPAVLINHLFPRSVHAVPTVRFVPLLMSWMSPCTPCGGGPWVREIILNRLKPTTTTCSCSRWLLHACVDELLSCVDRSQLCCHRSHHRYRT
uniref:Putative secreted protein n=1 Tax=Anopheles darlingi TaxID=43151 RepID=A0A2M4D8D6_ANODA